MKYIYWEILAKAHGCDSLGPHKESFTNDVSCEGEGGEFGHIWCEKKLPSHPINRLGCDSVRLSSSLG